MTRPLAVRGVVGGFAASMDINGEQFRRDGKQVTSGPFHRKGLRGAVGIGPKNMSKDLTLLSSGAFSASPFQRKGLLLYVMQHW